MRSLSHPRRQALFRHTLFTAALLTYFLDPVDIVWRVVQHSAHPRAFERLAFTTATLLLAGAIITGTCSARQRGQVAANLLYVGAVVFLLPWEGALLLLLGEVARSTFSKSEPPRNRGLVYVSAFLSMALFSVTLQDRVADVLFGATLVLALVLDFLPASR